MITALAAAGVAALLTLAGLALATPAQAASLVEVTNFGPNPSNLRMHLYVPDRVQPRPPILVAVHYCTGTGPAFYSGTEFARLADQYGYIVIYPSATRSGQCFDVSTPPTLSHNGGSDSLSIVSMVNYVKAQYNADANRVFATGLSSGAMMTNVLLGAYPDVFKAGAAFAGVPFACFATTDGSLWNTACAQGQINRTPQQWGDLVRNAFPGFTGTRPRMMIWHGTADDTLRYPNFQEQIDQWTNVNGLSTTPTSTDTPQAGWTRTRYASGGIVRVEAISIQNGTHNILQNGMAQRAIEFFGLNTTSTGSPSVSVSPSRSVSPSASVSPSRSVSQPPGGCRITYTTNPWNTGLTADITIANTGSATINGWALVFTLPAGQTITGGWNATYAPTSGQVTARNLSYNGTLSAGASTTIGFQATHTGNSGKPTSFALNGSPCSVA
jgi:poly(hydroxyalkanoate) depolymerase family esterase